MEHSSAKEAVWNFSRRTWAVLLQPHAMFQEDVNMYK